MRQKLLILLLVLVFLLPARLSAFIYKYEGVKLRYEVIDEEAKTCMVYHFDTYDMCDLVIPDIANDGTTDYSVTTIGPNAFNGCTDLTSVVIPNSVTSIGSHAFLGCTDLKKAEFSSIESLCNIAFYNQYSNPLSYAHCLYIDGKEVTEAVIPETFTSIGDYAFSGCSGLTSVVIPNSVTSI